MKIDRRAFTFGTLALSLLGFKLGERREAAKQPKLEFYPAVSRLGPLFGVTVRVQHEWNAARMKKLLALAHQECQQTVFEIARQQHCTVADLEFWEMGPTPSMVDPLIQYCHVAYKFTLRGPNDVLKTRVVGREA